MTRRLATICLVTVFWISAISPSVRGQDELKGISTLIVGVEKLPAGAKVIGLTEESIQNDVELKLRLAGIHIATSKEAGIKVPFLYVRITLLSQAQAANIEIQIMEEARLLRNGQFATGVFTWEKGGVVSNPTARLIRDLVKDNVDEFLNAWLAVNPKK
jgi:hypothetical protein